MTEAEQPQSFAFGEDYDPTQDAQDIRTTNTNTTGWFPCALAWDDAFPDHMHSDTLPSLGKHRGPGLNTEARLLLGRYTSPALQIRYRVRDQGASPIIAYHVIPLQGCTRADIEKGIFTKVLRDHSDKIIAERPEHWNEWSTEVCTDIREWMVDTDTLRELLPAERTFQFTELRPAPHQTEMQFGSYSFLKIKTPSNKWNLRVVNTRDISEQFLQNAVRQILSDIQNLQDKTCIAIYTSETVPWAAWFHRLQNDPWDKPFAEILIDCRDSNSTDLTIDNYPVKFPPLSYCMEAQLQFTNDEQRAVSLMMGMVEELNIVARVNHAICTTDYKGFFIADSASAWKDPDAAKTYCVPSDNTPLHRWLVLPLNEVACLPEIGSSFQIFIPNISYGQRAIPQSRLNYTHIAKIADFIIAEIDSMEQAAANFAGNNEDPKGEDNKHDTLRHDHYISRAASFFYRVLRYGNDIDADATEPETNADLAVMKRAIEVAQSCRWEHMRDTEFRSKMITWVYKNSIIATAEEKTEAGLAWPATRIPLPAGAVPNIALISVRTPSRPGWILGFKPPPVLCDIATFKMPGNMNFTSLGWDIATNKIHEGLTAYTFKIFITNRNQTIDMESKAVSSMHSIKADSPAKVLNYVQPTRLLGNLDTSAFQGEHVQAFQKLASLEKPYASIHGCPGSGKSTIMERIAHAMMQRSDKNIVWISAQNSLLSKSVHDLSMDGKIVIRALPFEAEVKAVLLGRKGNFRIDSAKAPKCEKTLAHRFNSFKDAEDEESSPLDVPHSLARTLMESTDRELHDVYAAFITRRNNPDEDRRQLERDIRQTLIQLAQSADVIVATPVAMAQLANRAMIQPSAIFIDDAGRLHEPLTWTAWSKFPDTPIIMSGDATQFRPMVLADQMSTTGIGTKQRGMALLQRLFNMGQVDVTLKQNHRPICNVQNWAQSYFYKNDMNIVHRQTTAATRRNIERIKKLTFDQVPHQNMIFVALEGTREDAVGTTWLNSASAEIVIETALHLFHAYSATFGDNPKVLINTPYTAQKLELEGRFAAVKDCEAKKDKFTILTIDSSPSHQAHIVLTDLTRTSPGGFMKDRGRVAVMATRAQVLHLVFGTTRALGSHLKSLHRHCKRGNSEVVIDDCRLCIKCRRIGHKAADCPNKLQCPACNEDHHIRSCRRTRRGRSYAIQLKSPLKYEQNEDKQDLATFQTGTTTDNEHQGPALPVPAGKRSKNRRRERLQYQMERKPSSGAELMLQAARELFLKVRIANAAAEDGADDAVDNHTVDENVTDNVVDERAADESTDGKAVVTDDTVDEDNADNAVDTERFVAWNDADIQENIGHDGPKNWDWDVEW